MSTSSDESFRIRSVLNISAKILFTYILFATFIVSSFLQSVSNASNVAIPSAVMPISSSAFFAVSESPSYPSVMQSMILYGLNTKLSSVKPE